MDLPSARELELELLLRERDTQLAELTDEISTLQHYIAKQPGPSITEPVSLPPALLAIILPHLNNTPADSTSGSSTVTAALTQRTRVLQEENDELYNLLKRSETGKLMDEVTGQQRIISRLETALKESHTVIKSLSTELDKAYETITSLARPSASRNNYRRPTSHSRSPANSYQTAPQLESANSNGKQLPTGPRAHKKPRISEPNQSSPQPRPIPSLPYKPQTSQHSHGGGGHGHGSHGHSHGHNIPHIPPRPDLRVDQARGHVNDSRKGGSLPQGGGARMDIDNESKNHNQKRTSSPHRRERETRRERDKPMKDRVREHLSAGSQGAGGAGAEGGHGGGGFKERERDRDRPPRDNHRQPNNQRRNGNFSNAPGRGGGVAGGGGTNNSGPGRRINDTRGYNAAPSNQSSDRTLQERLGL
ncbi:hypothetical protein BJ165DRAFT_1521039 [Panaeolus papilionaceus]|nr:hypothetical protein BJ165DRAFT_1521039 [Panaeolus papilionaceus]